MKQIEGLAKFTEDGGFCFDSGLPSNEPVLEKPMKMRGVLSVSQNACAEFLPNSRVVLPPEMHHVSRGLNYHVKRSSRNYILQVKLPIVQSRAVSQETLENIAVVALGDITIDRKEILNV